MSVDRAVGQVTTMPIGSRAKILNIWTSHMVFCQKYVGKFKVQSLQSKADTEEWMCHVSGNPHSQVGCGHSPEYAMRDTISRNNDLIKKLTQANQEIEAALAKGNYHVV